MKGVLILKDKKGVSNGLVSSIVFGVTGLVLAVIITFVIINTLTNSGILTANSAEANATSRMVSNFTSGIDNISSKLPTLLLVAAIVLILSVLAILVSIWQRMKVGGGSVL